MPNISAVVGCCMSTCAESSCSKKLAMSEEPAPPFSCSCTPTGSCRCTGEDGTALWWYSWSDSGDRVMPRPEDDGSGEASVLDGGEPLDWICSAEARRERDESRCPAPPPPPPVESPDGGRERSPAAASTLPAGLRGGLPGDPGPKFDDADCSR